MSLCSMFAGVEILDRYPDFIQASEVKQFLPCLCHRSVSMQCPGQALSDVDTKVLEAVQPLIRLMSYGGTLLTKLASASISW